MTSVIATIELKSANDKKMRILNNNQDKGIYLTRALQCQRINPATDVKNNAVYLNGLPENTLEEELNEKCGEEDEKKES